MPRGVDPNRQPFQIFSAREIPGNLVPANTAHPHACLPPALRQAAFEDAFVRRVRHQAELRLRRQTGSDTSGGDPVEGLLAGEVESN